MSGLPVEVWGLVWSLLSGDGDSLLACREVCRGWREEVSRLVRTSPTLARNTFTLLTRLTYHPGDDALDHRKSVRTGLRFSVDKDITFHGVLLYTGNDKEILDLTVPVVFDRVTSVLTVYREKETVAQESVVTTIEEARRNVTARGHLPHTEHLRLGLPIKLARNVWYDLEVVF